MLVPPFFPLHLFDLVGFARVHLVPIMAAAARTFAVKPRQMPDLSDLFRGLPSAGPQQPDLIWFHELIDSGLRSLPSYLRPARELGLREAERFLLDRLEPDGTLYSFFTATFLMIFALLALGYRPDHPVIIRAVRGPERVDRGRCLSRSSGDPKRRLVAAERSKPGRRLGGVVQKRRAETIRSPRRQHAVANGLGRRRADCRLPQTGPGAGSGRPLSPRGGKAAGLDVVLSDRRRPARRLLHSLPQLPLHLAALGARPVPEQISAVAERQNRPSSVLPAVCKRQKSLRSVKKLQAFWLGGQAPSRTVFA